jgi:hypothetical protein
MMNLTRYPMNPRTGQLGLFAPPAEPFTVKVLYRPDSDRAFWNNEQPQLVAETVVEAGANVITDYCAELAEKVNADPALPREHKDSVYLVRAFDAKGNLRATTSPLSTERKGN